MHLPIYKNVLF